MTNEEKQAYDWALHQNYQSVAAKNAKTLAEFVKKILSVKSGDPLTLEQLREMDGRPVWVETGNQFSDWGKVDFNRRRIWPFGTAGEWWDFRYYGDWVPYAYPPAHIDREAWTAEWTVDEFGHKCSKCGEYLPDGEDVRKPQFCPECGRAMTPEAWAMLEKRLRG